MTDENIAGVDLPWWDKRLAYADDSRETARYRLLQSWWREVHLQCSPGWYVDRNGVDRPLGSWLPGDRTWADQLLSEEALSYSLSRVPKAIAEGENIDPVRFGRNLLSSQPLCFSLFGHLRAHLSEAARVLDRVLPVDVLSVQEIVCEHAPSHARGKLQDATSFDAYLEVTTTRGGVLLGIETKYTEPFSRPTYIKPTYRAAVTSPHSWFAEDAADALQGSATNQVWRQTMLLQEAAMDLRVDGLALVVSRGADPAARRAVAGVRERLLEPDDHLQHVALEDLIEAATLEPELAVWAARFRERYLEVELAVRPT